MALSLLIAVVAGWAADTAAGRQLGVGALTLAILIGMLIGNTVFPRLSAHCGAGVDFSKASLLRLGIILYGFRIVLQDVAVVGWSGILIGGLVLCLTFTIAIQFGIRVLKLDRETAVLIGAGSAICGAAAIMATAPVVQGRAEKVSIAVATIVVFGTLSMFLYPLLYPILGLSEHAYGVFVGSTIHEVAQVVVAGDSIGAEASAAAVVEKMLRVMMLAPFLLVLPFYLKRGREPGAAARFRVTIPWFAVLFLVATGINSTALVPEAVVTALVQLDGLLLAMAMSALGLTTDLGAVRRAGSRPLLLGFVLFAFLILGGYLINVAVTLAMTATA